MNTNYKQHSVNIDDIESKIIILKRRAAEANFLREERDMLLNRLKLYSNDYVWPETGDENFAEEMLAGNEAYKKLKEKNDSLTKENEFLNEAIHSMEIEIMNLESIKNEFEIIREENETIKNELDRMTSLEEDVQYLVLEKRELTEQLEAILAISNSDDPDSKYKTQIKRLLSRANQLKKEKETLTDQLMSKNLKIDILLGKISHLEARINEKCISARLKVKLGETLEPDEALLWTVHKLESANKIMGEDLCELTSKFDEMNDKYKQLLLQTKTATYKDSSPRDSYPKRKYPLDSDERKWRILSTKTYQEFEDIMNHLSSGKKNDIEGGSTGPSSPQGSLESFEDRKRLGSLVGYEVLLAAMYSSAKSVKKYHYMLEDLRRQIAQDDTSGRLHTFYSDVQGGGPQSSFMKIGSSVFYGQDDMNINN